MTNQARNYFFEILIVVYYKPIKVISQQPSRCTQSGLDVTL